MTFTFFGIAFVFSTLLIVFAVFGDAFCEDVADDDIEVGKEEAEGEEASSISRDCLTL